MYTVVYNDYEVLTAKQQQKHVFVKILTLANTDMLSLVILVRLLTLAKKTLFYALSTIFLIIIFYYYYVFSETSLFA